MRFLFFGLLALAAHPAHARISPALNITAAASSVGQYESDMQELAAWIQLLNMSQSNLSGKMDLMWAEFERHNKLAATSTEEELQPSYLQLLDQIKSTKAALEVEKAHIIRIQILTGNVILNELPAGHLKKLHDYALTAADGFLQLADRAETQVTAMMLGEQKLGDEFALLMADSTLQLVSGQLNLTRSNAALVKKGSASAYKMSSMVKVYEAMEHIMREQRKISANEALAVDLVTVKRLASDMQSDTQLGMAAVKKEREKLAVNRKYLTPLIAESHGAQLESIQGWFDYLAVETPKMAAFPDRIETLDPGDPALNPVFDIVINLEAKFLDLHSKMLERVIN